MKIEIEDQCGGIPDSTVDPFKPFADRRRNDRTGLGLGLSIARKAIRMHGGTSIFATCLVRAAFLSSTCPWL